MQRKIIKTKDNSKTLLIPEMNETYHSTNGAIAESKHIYIEHGLKLLLNKNESIHIFEMGFGTGLNAILTLDFSLNNNLFINYTTIEKFPITNQEIIELNYTETLGLNALKESYDSLHQSTPNQQLIINEQFSFIKHHQDIKTIVLPNNTYDIIYFDAFAPQHQPDLWTIEILQKMYDSLAINGFLITYCAQGQFKRNLKSIGFDVIPLPGPIGKREITKAVKK